MPGFNGSIIPSWYFRQHRKGNLPPRSINIITIHSAFLTSQMENQKSPASFISEVKNLEHLCMGSHLEDILGLRED